MNIYIDADACPVKDIVIEEATIRQIPVTIVSSISHYSTTIQPAGVTTIYVDNEAEAADYRIMKLAQKDDIIITQDYGLAALTLGKGCIVLHQKGFIYNQDNIEQLLQNRHLGQLLRKNGQRTKGPKPFTIEDRNLFRKKLNETLVK